jgi:hypothetical protein
LEARLPIPENPFESAPVQPEGSQMNISLDLPANSDEELSTSHE